MHTFHRLVALAVAAAATAAGCAGAPGATQQQLETRAVFDLGCAQQQLVVYHVDARTKAVAGCGRRLVYVESCQRIRGQHACTWVLDTPSYQQTQWPAWQGHGGPPSHAAAARPAATQLFDRARPSLPVKPPPPAPSSTTSPADDDPTTAVAPARGSARRPTPTDLFDPAVDADRTPAGREIPTNLFDPEEL